MLFRWGNFYFEYDIKDGKFVNAKGYSDIWPETELKESEFTDAINDII